MIPAGFAVIDLKDCFFTIPLHDNDKEEFAFTLPSINNEKPTQQCQWKVLPQSMKNSPTICQSYVHATLVPFHEKWPQIKCFHYMDGLLIAHTSLSLLQQALRDLETCLAKEGLSLAPDKTQLYPPFKYLGHTIVNNIVKPPKLKLDIKEVMTLNELQTLLGNINWIWHFLKIPSDSLKPVFEL
jgi:hypothetical protein